MAAGTLAIRFAFQPPIKEKEEQDTIPPLKLEVVYTTSVYISLTTCHVWLQKSLGNAAFILGDCYRLSCIPPKKMC